MISLPKKGRTSTTYSSAFLNVAAEDAAFYMFRMSLQKMDPVPMVLPNLLDTFYFEQPKICLFIMAFMKIQIAKIPTLSLSELPLLSEANIFQNDPVVWLHYNISPTSNP